jgi:hypothetical protein
VHIDADRCGATPLPVHGYQSEVTGYALFRGAYSLAQSLRPAGAARHVVWTIRSALMQLGLARPHTVASILSSSFLLVTVFQELRQRVVRVEGARRDTDTFLAD